MTSSEFRNSSLWILASFVIFASLQALISAIMPLVNQERIMLEDDMPFLKQVVDDAHQAQARARLWHGGAATPP